MSTTYDNPSEAKGVWSGHLGEANYFKRFQTEPFTFDFALHVFELLHKDLAILTDMYISSIIWLDTTGRPAFYFQLDLAQKKHRQ